MSEKYYLVKELELDEIAHYKDLKTRLLKWNVIKSRGDTTNYSGEWDELKKWLIVLHEGLASKKILVRADMCKIIIKKMREIELRSKNPDSNIKLWFTGEDCKKCNGHIYTDGNMDWCSKGCPRNENPSSWRGM